MNFHLKIIEFLEIFCQISVKFIANIEPKKHIKISIIREKYQTKKIKNRKEKKKNQAKNL